MSIFKKFLCLLGFLIFGSLNEAGALESERMRAFGQAFVAADGTPQPELVKLFRLTGAIDADLPDPVTLAQLNDISQAKWLRKPGQERMELLAHMDQAKHAKVIDVLRNLGCMDEKKPLYQAADYWLIFGSLGPNMQQRMAYANEMWKQGYTCEKVVILVGERPLDPVWETPERLLNPAPGLHFREGWEAPSVLPTQEAEAALLAWDQVITEPALREKMEMVSVPMKVVEALDDQHKPTTRLVRPNTADTIVKWLETQPKEGIYIGFSSNPFITYQLLTLGDVLERAGKLSENVILDVAGPATISLISLPIHLDNIARCLYTLVHNQKFKEEQAAQ